MSAACARARDETRMRRGGSGGQIDPVRLSVRVRVRDESASAGDRDAEHLYSSLRVPRRADGGEDAAHMRSAGRDVMARGDTH